MEKPVRRQAKPRRWMLALVPMTGLLFTMVAIAAAASRQGFMNLFAIVLLVGAWALLTILFVRAAR